MAPKGEAGDHAGSPLHQIKIGGVMRFYNSYEAYVPATDSLAKMLMPVRIAISKVFEINDYGKDVELLAIISACVPKSFIEDTGWKERNRYLKKDHSTDIRLFIDWEKFTTVSEKERQEMYLKHIFESIKQFYEKHKKLDFDGEKALSDAKEALAHVFE